MILLKSCLLQPVWKKISACLLQESTDVGNGVKILIPTLLVSREAATQLNR